MGSRGKVLKTVQGLTTKVLEDSGIVEAIVSVFGVLDDGDDIVHPGAFSKTVSERGHRVRVLDQHNTDSTDRVLGKPIEMREIAQAQLPQEVRSKYPEATGGLYTKTQYNLETKAGAEAFARIKAGDIQEYSFAYEVLDYDFSDGERDGQSRRVRNLRTLKLWEYGPVIWGMNPATTTVGVKASTEKGHSMTYLGDYIHSKLVYKLTYCLTDLYSSGNLTTEEFDELLQSGLTHLKEFRNEMSDDIATRQMGADTVYYMERGEPNRESGVENLKDNAGSPEDPPKKNEQEEDIEDAAGPETPPTEDLRQTLLERSEKLDLT